MVVRSEPVYHSITQKLSTSGATQWLFFTFPELDQLHIQFLYPEWHLYIYLSVTFACYKSLLHLHETWLLISGGFPQKHSLMKYILQPY